MANFKSVDRIITAQDYGGSATGYIRKMQQKIHRERGIAVTIKDLDKEPTGKPVYARIWQGQWIADCECKGAGFVDPDDPRYFCFSCGNRMNGSKPRPVIFPPTLERLEIERLLLERPVDDMAGLTDLERAGMAKALLEVPVEVEEEPDLTEVMRAVQAGEIPKGRTVKRTLPLVRSWVPGETVEDLHKQQDYWIQKWRKELQGDGHGVR